MPIKIILLWLLLFVAMFTNANAATLTCDGSQSDCQAKVNAAVDGDTVSIPEGSFDWGSTYINMVYSKNINIMGAGINKTTITGTTFFFLIGIQSKASWRISGMSLVSTGTQQMIKINAMDFAPTSTYGWRVDHIAFNSETAPTSIGVYGVTWGLIDHCTFNKPSGITIMVNTKMTQADTTYSGDYDLSLPLALGSKDAVYVEDCVFSFTNKTLPMAFDMDGGGGRIVFRYNTVNDGELYNHWNQHNHFAGMKWEVYNNKFIGGAWAGSGGNVPSRFQAGTGVIFNNTVTGYSGNSWKLDELRGCGAETSDPLGACDGTKAWDGNLGNGTTEGAGWPCINQIGRATGKTISQIVSGDKQDSSPAYAWNNGSENGCSEGGTCTNSVNFSRYNPCTNNTLTANVHSNGEYDYINNGSTPMPNYSPLQYPHPLVGYKNHGSPKSMMSRPLN